MELLPGKILGGRYRIEGLVGEGGMGAVYEAVQQDLDRRVALKILHQHLTDDVELRGRFQREARVVAMLGHPNVVQISDFQAHDGEPPFFVMELLHGENLRDLLKRMTVLPPERVAYIAVQVLSALEAAHPTIRIFTPVVDRGLNAQKFILPGLGDFGDRLYGT